MTVVPVTPPSVDLAVGAVWDVVVMVTDPDGLIVDDAPVADLQLPDGSPSAPVMTEVAGGIWRAQLVTTLPGRYVGTITSAGNGAADFTAWVTARVDAAGMPKLADLRGTDPTRSDPADLGYLGQNSFTDDELQDALDAEAAAQRRVCRVPANYPPDLRQALLRRVWRNLAMRGQPFLTVPGAEDGAVSVVPGLDAEIRRFERPYRKLVMG